MFFFNNSKVLNKTNDSQIIDSVSVCILNRPTKYTICQLFCSCVYSSHCQGQKVESGSKVKSDDSAQHQVSVQLRNPRTAQIRSFASDSRKRSSPLHR